MEWRSWERRRAKWARILDAVPGEAVVLLLGTGTTSCARTEEEEASAEWREQESETS